MVGRHGPSLLRVANQFSLCHDDALDAYQRALEIYLRRFETVDAATEGAWMRVVVKHEAMAIRKARAADRHRLVLDDHLQPRDLGLRKHAVRAPEEDLQRALVGVERVVVAEGPVVGRLQERSAVLGHHGRDAVLRVHAPKR